MLCSTLVEHVQLSVISAWSVAFKIACGTRFNSCSFSVNRHLDLQGDADALK